MASPGRGSWRRGIPWSIPPGEGRYLHPTGRVLVFDEGRHCLYTVVPGGTDRPFHVISKPAGFRPSARPAPGRSIMTRGWAVYSSKTCPASKGRPSDDAGQPEGGDARAAVPPLVGPTIPANGFGCRGGPMVYMVCTGVDCAAPPAHLFPPERVSRNAAGRKRPTSAVAGRSRGV